MQYKVGYIVNSNIAYSLPLSMCLETLTKYTENIHVFISDSQKEYIFDIKGIKYTYVDHDSYDFTSLIWIVENVGKLPYTHVFCLQDTMLCGENFTKLVEQADMELEGTAADNAQCNLALYRLDYIYSRASAILSMRNCSKLTSIEYEGILFKTAFSKDHYKGKCITDRTLHYPYSKSIPRIMEYYDGIDLIKYKANWGQNMQNLTLHP